MRSKLRDEAINWLLRIATGSAFLSAGVLKILNPARFADSINNYRLLPHELINPAAILLPWIELVAALCVLAGFWLRAGALLITGMTALFFLSLLPHSQGD